MAAAAEHPWRGPAAMVVALGIAAGVVGAVQALRRRGALGALAARKLMHIATGLVFIATWPLFGCGPHARRWAAAVPGAMTLRFVAAGCGAVSDPQLVASTTRTGDKRELLGGPTLYGAAHVAAALLCFTAGPAAAAALCALCAGDGLADVAGRRWGGGALGRLPWSRQKTWAGSLACLAGSWAATLAAILYLRACGEPLGVGHLSISALSRGCALCAAAAAAVESLPFPEVDNLTVPLAAALVAHAVFGA
ncbi:MAG: hypothetical protein J3K34DRAFT_7229 [Monoraphidium minutum]|nr:MAG: hypothetical protein J3K34DRAFT_7229 [Monoraphidium minutum]